MPGNHETRSLAVFCDFENVALGVREARYAQFDMAKVLERLLAKGSIVVKKAYCDWERYKEFKAAMHAAAFELIEIPHVRQSGKNSADIRMVVDALDLCYTKEHIDTFVIISGDSDFSPLVSKLRENAKTVIGIGMKNSTSDLLMSNCDEFIFYDDLVARQPPARKRTRARPKAKVAPDRRDAGDVAGAGREHERSTAPVPFVRRDEEATLRGRYRGHARVGLNRRRDHLRVARQEIDDLRHGTVAVGIVAFIAKARQPALPVGRQQAKRIPAFGAP